MLATHKMTGSDTVPLKQKKKTKRGEVAAAEAETKKSKKVADESYDMEVAKKFTSKTKKSSLKPQEPSPPEPNAATSDDEYIYGFTSDDDDSSDEDDAIGDMPEPGIGLLKLPTVPKDDATVKRRLELAKRQPVNDLL